MDKRNMLTAAGVAGAVAAGYLMKDKQNREKISQKVNTVKQKVKTYYQADDSTFEDAGVPDQTDGQDPALRANSKMVSEGSQFGVQYYNEKKDENKLENQQN
ncbi:hypothetical protein ACFOGI_08050 [Virgibacillus xinjiangensis]|uniref:YtxH-like protein n=1 Tax=Virgibacillus xinjiangensis TaxID=393090 RepID=A0ABV7CUP4_9BACI